MLLPLLFIPLDAMEVDYSGYLRFGYQTFENNQLDVKDTALGGKFNLELKHKDYFAIGASIYSSNALSDAKNEGVAFFSSTNNSYSLLGEAYLRANLSKTEVIIGRHTLDTPYTNPDDYGMIPNSFEGVQIVSKDIENSKLHLGYLTKWSGVDAPKLEQFTKLNGEDGLWYAGYIYSGFENTQLKAWYYSLPNFANASYFEANYHFVFDAINLGVSGQYSLVDYDSGDESRLYGLMLEASHEGVEVKLAYNEVDGVAANYFLGQGPFFTGVEFFSIVEAGDNGKALLLSLGYDASTIGLKNVNFSMSYLTLQRERLADITEMDFMIEYAYNKELSLQLVYSDVEDKSFADESFKDLRVFVNYSF